MDIGSWHGLPLLMASQYAGDPALAEASGGSDRLHLQVYDSTQWKERLNEWETLGRTAVRGREPG